MNDISAPTVSGKTVATLARGVRLRDDPVRGRTVLLAPERALALDDIAVMIVKALDGNRSLESIAEDFAVKFDTPVEQILSDVVAFVSEFANRRMLELKS